MSSPKCHVCKYYRTLKAWQKLENGEWKEYDGNYCFHPEARKHFNPNRNGGVQVGNVCWICRGTWV